MNDRPDLPAEVRALIARLGVPTAPADRIAFRQTGRLRQGPGSGWMHFSARQTTAVREPGFRWRARVGPLGAVRVVDYLEGDRGGGGVSLFGLLPLARSENSPGLIKGELQRYLAELAWAPDAMAANRRLRWRAEGPDALTVGAALAGVEAQVLFRLDGQGLIAGVEAIRPRLVGKATVETPWRARFGDYREVEGRRAPMAGEVSWIVDGQAFVVWRGNVSDWRTLPPHAPEQR